MVIFVTNESVSVGKMREPDIIVSRFYDFVCLILMKTNHLKRFQGWRAREIVRNRTNTLTLCLYYVLRTYRHAWLEIARNTSILSIIHSFIISNSRFFYMKKFVSFEIKYENSNKMLFRMINQKNAMNCKSTECFIILFYTIQFIEFNYLINSCEIFPHNMGKPLDK